MIDTVLDKAVRRIEQNPTDAAERLAFYGQLASSELFILLDAEPKGETVEPRLFETTDGEFVLVFDTEDRLTTFAEGPAPYAALPGRRLAAMLSGRGIGIGLNLGVSPSAQLLPSEAVAWLSDTLANEPEQATAKFQSLGPPGDIPVPLLNTLDSQLAKATGLASCAYVASATYQDGRRGHLIVLIDPAAGAETMLARAIQDALSFSGVDAGALDVTFLQADDPATEKLAKVGFRIDLPDPERTASPTAPGANPSMPPKLR